MEQINYKNTKNIDNIVCGLFEPNKLYTGKVVKVYDGDTMWIAVYVKQFDTICRLKIRLAEIDTPELRPKNGTQKEKEEEKKKAQIVRDLVARIILNETVQFNIIGLGKFKRFIGYIYPSHEIWAKILYPDYTKELCNLIEKDKFKKLSLNTYLLAFGHAMIF